MSSQSSIDLAQQMFVAYYGRPADPEGLAYWASIFDSSSDLTQALSAFGHSEEFTNNFGSLSNNDLVTNLFQQMYGREPDAGGLAFYVDLLASGEATLSSIVKQIADGSQNTDLVTLNNRIAVANTFTDKIDTLNAVYNSSHIADVQALLAMVDDTDSSLAAGHSSVLSYASNLSVEAFTPIVLTFDDPGNELTLYQADIINNVQAAWDRWDDYIDAHANASIEIVIKPIDEAGVLARAGSLSSALVQGDVWRGSVGHELIYGEDVTGADFDAQIFISTQYLTQVGYYDFTPDDGVTADQISFEGVMTHELGHALGFNGWFEDPDFYSPYELLVDRQADTFIGENAVAVNGGPVDLETGGWYHLDEQAFPDSAMSTYSNFGGEDVISDVEIAILADIGLPVNEQFLIV